MLGFILCLFGFHKRKVWLRTYLCDEGYSELICICSRPHCIATWKEFIGDDENEQR